ncbi:MAG: hypothetical protein ABH879_04830 [archaeon]
MRELRERIENLRSHIRFLSAEGTTAGDRTRELYDFKEKRRGYYRGQAETILNGLKARLNEFRSSVEPGRLVEMEGMIDALSDMYNSNKIAEMPALINELAAKVSQIRVEETSLDIRLPRLPPEIREDISLDFKEILKGYGAGCHRAIIVLCGRILETALHRKYYELTGKDILETAPSIGLGKLVAKLKEMKIELSPGVTQQIHLINQMRIESVHKKKKTFYPTKEQAQAIVLYTIDVLNKMFQQPPQDL